MRRLLTFSAFLLLAFVISASAQRGGMRASGGGHGVSVGHPSVGHVSSGRSFSGMHAGPGITASHSFHGGGFGGPRIRSGGFRNCVGCRRGFGYLGYGGYPYGGYYGPAWAWDAWDPSSSYDYEENQARQLALANEMNTVNLEEQRLREQEERDRDQDMYARRSQPRDQRTNPGPATALVFRDQHVEEVRNYAIAGGTLWVLNEQSAKKIPLAQLDLAATVKMNDERGVDFQVPR